MASTGSALAAWQKEAVEALDAVRQGEEGASAALEELLKKQKSLQ